MLDRSLVNGFLGLRIGRLERLTGAVLHGVQSPERYRNPKQLLQETLRLSATEMVHAGQEPNDSYQTGPEGRRRDLVCGLKPPVFGLRIEDIDLMPPPLGDVGPVVTEIDLLIAASFGVRRGRERGRASPRGSEFSQWTFRSRLRSRFGVNNA